MGGSENITVMESSELPAPDRSDLLSESRPYLIGAFDKLIIDVFGIEELSEKEGQKARALSGDRQDDADARRGNCRGDCRIREVG